MYVESLRCVAPTRIRAPLGLWSGEGHQPSVSYPPSVGQLLKPSLLPGKHGCTIDATNHPLGRKTVATVASAPERSSISIMAISQVQPSKRFPFHQLGTRVTSACR